MPWFRDSSGFAYEADAPYNAGDQPVDPSQVGTNRSGSRERRGSDNLIDSVTSGVNEIGNFVGGPFEEGIEMLPFIPDDEEEAAREEAERLRQQQMQGIAGARARMPSAQDLQQNYVGPQYEEMVQDWGGQLGPSNAGQAQADQGAIDAQRGALAGFQEIYEGDGLTDSDRQAIRAGQMENAIGARGQRDALMQNMQERGMGGSGAMLAGLLSANNSAVVGNTLGASAINSAAQQRALQALQGAGNLGGQMRDSSFQENFKRGSALDDWNAEVVRYRSEQAYYNNKLANQQAEANADTSNMNEDARVRAQKDEYGYDMDLTAMETGQYDKNISDQRNNIANEQSKRQNFTNQMANAVTMGMAPSGTGAQYLGGSAGGSVNGQDDDDEA